MVRGVTKLPWSTTAPSWTWLLAAVTELRTLIAGATCEVGDDHDAIAWSEAAGCYTVAPITIAGGGDGAPRSTRARAPRRPPGTIRFACTRLERHQRNGNVVVRDEDVPRFELGAQARFEAALWVRTAIAARIEQATLRLLAADGAVLQAAARATWHGFDVAPATVAQLAMIEVAAETVTPCEGHPVARLACGAVGPDGAIALTRVEGPARYPCAAVAVRMSRTDDPPALTIDHDGGDERLLVQRDLTIDFIVFAASGAELARASVVGSLADRHAVTIPITAERLAEVRRLDVRVTGTLIQAARVGRWQLARARPRGRTAKA